MVYLKTKMLNSVNNLNKQTVCKEILRRNVILEWTDCLIGKEMTLTFVIHLFIHLKK